MSDMKSFEFDDGVNIPKNVWPPQDVIQFQSCSVMFRFNEVFRGWM